MIKNKLFLMYALLCGIIISSCSSSEEDDLQKEKCFYRAYVTTWTSDGLQPVGGGQIIADYLSTELKELPNKGRLHLFVPSHFVSSIVPDVESQQPDKEKYYRIVDEFYFSVKEALPSAYILDLEKNDNQHNFIEAGLFHDKYVGFSLEYGNCTAKYNKQLNQWKGEVTIEGVRAVDWTNRTVVEIIPAPSPIVIKFCTTDMMD